MTTTRHSCISYRPTRASVLILIFYLMWYFQHSFGHRNALVLSLNLDRAQRAINPRRLSHFHGFATTHSLFDLGVFLSQSLCSSSGGVATFDMTLGLIERYQSRELARQVSEILTYRPTNSDGPQQKMLAQTSLMRLDRNLEPDSKVQTGLTP